MDQWTGGQYSVVRVLAGLYLAGAAVVLSRGEMGAIQAVGWIIAVLGLVLAVGWRERWMAGGLAAAWAGLHLLRPELLLTGPVLDRWSWLGLAIAVGLMLMPVGAYGSAAAWGRVDPGGGWRFSRRAAWYFRVVLGGYYLGMGFYLSQLEAGLSGLMWLATVVWLMFVPLALVGVTRPWGWLAGLIVAAVVLPLTGHWGLAGALVVLHLLTFEPRWLARRRADGPEMVFYDGRCGLCHRAVRFALAEDPGGELFVFSPLQGDAFERQIPAEQRQALPDSLIVQRRPEGSLLIRSVAVVHMLDRLGGLWRVVGWLLWVVPRPLRDAAYRMVATVRRRMFGSPAQTCPLTPEGLADRFR